jgi:hypothetical protein
MIYLTQHDLLHPDTLNLLLETIVGEATLPVIIGSDEKGQEWRVVFPRLNLEGYSNAPVIRIVRRATNETKNLEWRHFPMRAPSVGPVHSAETEGVVLEAFDLSQCASWFTSLLWITEAGKQLRTRIDRCVSAIVAISGLSGYGPLVGAAAKVARVLVDPHSRSVELEDAIVEACFVGSFCGIDYSTPRELDAIKSYTRNNRFLTVSDAHKVVNMCEALIQSDLPLDPQSPPAQKTHDLLRSAFDLDRSAFVGRGTPVRELKNWQGQTKVRMKLPA